MLGLKSGTLSDYESYLRVHLVPFFGERSLRRPITLLRHCSGIFPD
jgi:hypothetical protein